LRGALVQSVDAVCPDCAMGLTWTKPILAVSVFAQTLVASCKQTGEVININYNSSDGNPVSYEDMWRFTLVNYNAGPGCLGLAVDKTSSSGEPLDWEHLSSHLTPACQGAIDTSTIISGQALLPSPSATATDVPTIAITEIPTMTCNKVSNNYCN